MKLSKVDNYQRYLDIVGQYVQKGCISNDYIQRDAEKLIAQGDLFESCGVNNAFLLIKQSTCYRVYYYLNDFEESHNFEGEELVTEILYRGEESFPERVVCYLERNGFVRNLVRDQYAAMYRDLSIGTFNTGVTVVKAQSLGDVKKACELFNGSFDSYSGDFISEKEYQTLIEHEDVIIAKNNAGNFLGALHQTLDNRVAWISHLAVVPEARGMGVGKALIDNFIESNHVDDRSRYMLWVQHENIPALKMYQKTGFKYLNKSTLSMIRQK